MVAFLAILEAYMIVVALVLCGLATWVVVAAVVVGGSKDGRSGANRRGGEMDRGTQIAANEPSPPDF